MNNKSIIHIFNQADINSYEELIKIHLDANISSHQILTKKYLKKLNDHKILVNKYNEMNIYENQVSKIAKDLIAGIDEVGRGCLAGPLVISIVVLDNKKTILGLNDSKMMSKSKREKIYSDIIANAIFYDTIIIDPKTVDQQNIYQATKNGMEDLIKRTKFDFYLVDAMKVETEKPHLSLIKGDTLSNSIASASIIAKVTRDKIMSEYSLIYPEFNFESNSGYGTPKHLAALKEHGYTRIHRKTYRPVSKHVEQKNKYINKRKK